MVFQVLNIRRLIHIKNYLRKYLNTEVLSKVGVSADAIQTKVNKIP